MPHTSPPWTPDMDRESEEFYRKLRDEKYAGHVDAIGDVRWSSEWRMHRGNGLNPLDATVLVFKAIDAIRAGRQPDPTPPGEYDVPWAPEMDAESSAFRGDLELLYQTHRNVGVDPIGVVRWSSDYRIARANGLSPAGAWDKIRREILGIWNVVPPSSSTRRPLVGPLRVVSKLFADDTGYRRVFFCSWFPALRILRDNPNEFYRQLDAIAAAGYQGFRTFLAVGGWTDFWDGREVVPVTFQKWHFTANHLRTDRLGHTVEAWPDYDDLLRTLLRACLERDLRLHLSCGDTQIMCPDPGRELELHRRFARICAEEGGTRVVALAGDTNEYPINRHGGRSPAAIAQMGRILKAWKDAIPGVLTGQGAGLSEEPDLLYESSTHGDVCIVHVGRDPVETCIKHTLGLVYWEGQYRFFPKPFVEGEPPGLVHPDMHAGFPDPASLTVVYAMHHLTGQWSNYFNGPAVRSREPLESTWGFHELPRILEQLPEDVATWDRSTAGNGAILYWHRGDRFATSYLGTWNPTPPRPVAEWTHYAGDSVAHGTGTPPAATGFLIGRFR